MSWNYITFLMGWFLAVSTVSTAAELGGGSTPLPTSSPSEDQLIIQAILGENAGDFATSRDTFEKLFALTDNKEYLLREAQDALSEQKDQARSITNLTQWVKRHPADHDQKLYLILAALYIQTHALSEADTIVDTYLTQGNVDAEDLQEFGALKIQLGEYAEALTLLQQAYAQSPSEQTALQIAALYSLKLQQPEKATAILEQHIARDPETSVGTYFKLIEMYAKHSQIGKVLALYKQLYRKDPQKYFLQKIIEISLYQKDTQGLIHFLESTKGNEDLLYGVYKDNRLYAKALTLAQKRYADTHRARWLSEEAILTYEQARDEHHLTPKVLDTMRRLFERGISEGNHESIYLNYYGYTLIEHDMDVAKGVDLVRQALGKDPKNIYYLDSLAWGLYKQGHCRKAATLIRRVVKKEGMSEPEIKDHYKAITACLNHKKH